ncbi:hypothetical protein PHAVU_008G197300 [Phaseolus vulgaris]|uniref:Uncharacterized protein n=1 Tax=Phaseolus vulgaris TaxID=3885 RepID=V7BAF5_PHAVU|nr:hypothetical protein PHAVU_008G197300g [Phaseolus vulgaris]ESW13451.1 hypothetical protein PHAVU_008G197300g [Phaseolus vulgaris]
MHLDAEAREAHVQMTATTKITHGSLLPRELIARDVHDNEWKFAHISSNSCDNYASQQESRSSRNGMASMRSFHYTRTFSYVRNVS